MAEIIEEKPTTEYNAELIDGKLHLTETSGPHQLGLGPGKDHIGIRHTTHKDVIEAQDIQTFYDFILRQRDDIKTNLVKFREQVTTLENMGVHEVGKVLSSMMVEIQKLQGKKNGLHKVQRILFKTEKGKKKSNPISAMLNNWNAYNQAKAGIEMEESRLDRVKKNIALLKEVLNKPADGTPTAPE